MSLKTKVKAGNITNLSDARYCAGMGVDWLGFPLHTVNPVTFKEITDWVAGPEFVLEISETASIDSIGQYPVTTLEISSDQLKMIEEWPSMQWMIRISISEWDKKKSELLKFTDKISYLVIDLDRYDEQAISDIASCFRILIKQSDSYSLEDLLSLPIEGINVEGENELKPGLKDYEKLSTILEELEILD